MARYLKTRTGAPTPAATWSGVRLRQSQVLGESGQIAMTWETIFSGGLLRTMACRKDMPLNLCVVDII